MPNSDEVYEGYVVIRTALQQTGTVAIGQLNMHGRGHLVGIKAHGKGHLLDERLGLRALLNSSHLLSTEVAISSTATRKPWCAAKFGLRPTGQSRNFARRYL